MTQQPWSPETFTANLRKVGASAYHDKHPFHLAMSSGGLEYFRSRLTQARRDSDEALVLTLTYCTTLESQEAAVRALQFKCDLLWAMLDAIHLATINQLKS